MCIVLIGIAFMHSWDSFPRAASTLLLLITACLTNPHLQRRSIVKVGAGHLGCLRLSPDGEPDHGGCVGLTQWLEQVCSDHICVPDSFDLRVGGKECVRVGV